MLELLKLEKDSPIPLYYQLKELIKTEIESGHLTQGQLIPSERELVEACQISRPTIRQAIHELVAEGLLVREKGRGTFVSKPKIDQRFLESLLSFSSEMEQKGLRHATKVLGLEVIETDSERVAVFGDACKQVIRLERVRYVEGEPLVAVTSYIPHHLVPGMENVNFEQSSLYDVIENKYGHTISHATRVIEAVNVAEEDIPLLDVEPMTAVQLIKTTAYLAGNQPFEYSIARYRGDNNSFTVTLSYRK